jgi:hypothetical protein
MPNGTKSQGNEEGITEDANGYQPAGGPQVSGGDCCSPFMANFHLVREQAFSGRSSFKVKTKRARISERFPTALATSNRIR